MIGDRDSAGGPDDRHKAHLADSLALSDRIRVGIRAYHSVHYLHAARYFAEQALVIEEAKRGETNFDATHRAYVTGAVLSAVAFLEAAINEFFQDAADGHDAYVGPLDPQLKKLLGESWNLLEGRGTGRLSIVDKYALATTLCATTPLSPGAPPLQAAKLLVRLRNHLTHFKPDTSWTDEESSISRQLKDKFPENALMSGMGNPFFPDKCLGAGCAQWAVESACTLADEFFRRVGIRAPFQPRP